MNLGDILVGASGGGLLGVLGGVATGVLNFFQKKQDNAFAIEMKKQERETEKLLGDLRQAQTAGDIAKLREQGAGDAFTESQRSGNRESNSYRLVNAVRDGTRPALTWYFTGLTTYIVVASSMGWLVLETLTDPLLQYAIVTVVNTTSMMIAWWFGQRQIDKVTLSWGNKSAGAKVG